MIAGQMAYVGCCSVCGKHAGPWRWNREAAQADVKAAPGWESSFCPECKNRPCDRSGPLPLPSGQLNTFAGD